MRVLEVGFERKKVYVFGAVLLTLRGVFQFKSRCATRANIRLEESALFAECKKLLVFVHAKFYREF